eukprot:g7682.t1
MLLGRRLPLALASRHSSLRPYPSYSFASSSDAHETIGFVGLGIMGMGMAQRLVKSGRKVLCWNRSPGRSQMLASAGATVAESPAQVVAKSSITYVMVTTPAVSRALFTQPQTGILAGVSTDKLVVECSTLNVETVQFLDKQVRERGGKFLEAPVSGSKVPAETGQLIFLCGGAESAFQAAAKDLDVMGKAKFLLGDVGKGTQMKLVVNMIMGSMMAAGAEGLALAEGAGLKPDDLIKVLSLGAMNCPLFAMKLPNMAQDKYDTHFPLKHAQKDMRLALEMADSFGQHLPVSATANQLYLASRAEFGDSDFSAVRESLV